MSSEHPALNTVLKNLHEEESKARQNFLKCYLTIRRRAFGRFGILLLTKSTMFATIYLNNGENDLRSASNMLITALSTFSSAGSNFVSCTETVCAPRRFNNVDMQHVQKESPRNNVISEKNLHVMKHVF